MLEDRQVTGTPKGYGGTHGWDDTSPTPGAYEEGSMPDMRGIFMARGPGIDANGVVTNWIKIIDEYQLFCHLLGIKAEPHNGTWERVTEFPSSSTSKVNTSYLIIQYLFNHHFCLFIQLP